MIKQRDFFKETSCDTINYYLHEPIAIKIGDYLAKKKFTPNNVTIFRGIIGLIASCLVFFYNGQINWILFAILIAFLLYISCMLDDVDGYMARKYNMKTTIGAWLDIIADAVVYLSLIIIIILNVNIQLAIFIGLMYLLGLGIKKMRTKNKCEPAIVEIFTNIQFLIIIPTLFVIKLKGS